MLKHNLPLNVARRGAYSPNLPNKKEYFDYEAGNADQCLPTGGEPHRHRRGRDSRRTVRRAQRAGQLRGQYLQRGDRQHRTQHPGGVRRFRRGPQRVLAHQRRRAAILPPGRLRPRSPAASAARARQLPPSAAGRAPRERVRRGRRRPGETRVFHRRPPAIQAAHPGHPSPRRRSARASHQGRHRQQRTDALDVHQHPRPLPGAHARAGDGSASRGKSRTKASAAGCATSCTS